MAKSSYPTYEEWKLNFVLFQKFVQKVLILPMRNGNYCTGFDNCSAGIRFLSYLWGMETEIWYRWYKYELCSYPTYEEWKLCKSFCSSAVEICSYPTYEEWKHNYFFVSTSSSSWFLSYLWGMETITNTTINVTITEVLILPMRNGNSYYREIIYNYLIMFLSYLWGMET